MCISLMYYNGNGLMKTHDTVLLSFGKNTVYPLNHCHVSLWCIILLYLYCHSKWVNMVYLYHCALFLFCDIMIVYKLIGVLDTFFRVTLVALVQSHDCPSATKVTLKHMGEIIFDLWVKLVITYPQQNTPDSKVHGANMGPIWGQQDPGGPHVSPHELCYLGPCSVTCVLVILGMYCNSIQYKTYDMDKWSFVQWSVWWNNLSILKLQWWSRCHTI